MKENAMDIRYGTCQYCMPTIRKLRKALAVCLVFAVLIAVNICFIKYPDLRRPPTKLEGKTDTVDEMIDTVQGIIRNVEHYNALQPILNEDRFGPLESDTVVIVVQVHNRIEYLRYSIASLGEAKGISEALLIFSHDYYDDNLNNLIRNITYCKVLQIFYPHSIQSHEHVFPGDDPNDCPRNINLTEAIERNCNNALHPDSYGHYREANITQTKHHWWWKANRVFDRLHVTRNHTGYVLFLEEDHYVAEDFLHVLALMQKQANALCPKCNVLSLGTYLKSIDKYTLTNADEVNRMPWFGSKHNMGFAINHNSWDSIKKCANEFCTFDDYNWDWSLLHISKKCLEEELYALMASRPRVFHIGECGLHHEKDNCKPDQLVAELRKALGTASKSLQTYPQNLTLAFSNGVQPHAVKPNGGWSDVRDHHLCLFFITPVDPLHNGDLE